MTNLRFDEKDIEAAVVAGALAQENAETFRAFLTARPQVVPAEGVAAPSRFDLTHLLWYAGALIIMGAMGLFSTLAFGAMGGWGLAATGIGYGLGLWFFGHRLWQNPETRTPGGLLIAAAVAMVPLTVYGLQSATDSWGGLGAPGRYQSFYTYVKSGWIPMELATLVTAVLAARRYSFAFIAFPAAFCLWFLSMDLAAFVADEKGLNWELRRLVSLRFGIVLFIATWIYELKARRADYAFWLHLVAALTFWGGLSFQSSGWEFGKFLYCLINIGLLAVSLFMGRRVYAVFGVIGITIYLGHLADKVFKDSILFPFALSALGLMIVVLGLWIARNRTWLDSKVQGIIPPQLAALRPIPARGDTSPR